MHKCLHTHARTYAHTHTHSHTRTRTHTHTHTHTYSHMYARTHTHTHNILHTDNATVTQLTLFKYPGSLHNDTTTYLSSHQWHINMSHDRGLQHILHLSEMMHQYPRELVRWLRQDTPDIPLT